MPGFNPNFNPDFNPDAGAPRFNANFDPDFEPDKGAPSRGEKTIPPGVPNMTSTAGIPRFAANEGDTKPQTPTGALQGAIDQFKAERQAQIEKLVSMGMPREQAEAYEVGSVSSLSPEGWKEGQAQDEASRKSAPLRVFEGAAHGAAAPLVTLASTPSGLVREAGKLAEAAGLEEAGRKIQQAGEAIRPSEAKKTLEATSPKTSAGQAADFAGHVGGMIPTLGVLGIGGFATQSAGNTMNEALDKGAGAGKTLAAGLGQAAKDVILMKATRLIPVLQTSNPTAGALVNSLTPNAGMGLAMTYGGNIIDKLTWDPERGVFDGTKDALTTGLAFGLLHAPQAVRAAEYRRLASEHPAGVDGFISALQAKKDLLAKAEGEMERTITLDPEGNRVENYDRMAFEKVNGSIVEALRVARRYRDILLKQGKLTEAMGTGQVNTAPVPPPEPPGSPAGTIPLLPLEAPRAPQPVSTPPSAAGPTSPAPQGGAPLAVPGEAPGTTARPSAGPAPAAAGPGGGGELTGRLAPSQVVALAEQAQEIQGLADQLEARAQAHPEVAQARLEADEAAALAEEARARLSQVVQTPITPEPVSADTAGGTVDEANPTPPPGAPAASGGAPPALPALPGGGGLPAEGAGGEAGLPGGPGAGGDAPHLDLNLPSPANLSGWIAADPRLRAQSAGRQPGLKIPGALAPKASPAMLSQIASGYAKAVELGRDFVNEGAPDFKTHDGAKVWMQPTPGGGLVMQYRKGNTHSMDVVVVGNTAYTTAAQIASSQRGKGQAVSMYQDVARMVQAAAPRTQYMAGDIAGGEAIRGLRSSYYGTVFSQDGEFAVTPLADMASGRRVSRAAAPPQGPASKPSAAAPAPNTRPDILTGAKAGASEVSKGPAKWVSEGDTFAHAGRQYRMHLTDDGRVKTRDLTLQGGPPIVRSWGSIEEFEAATGLRVNGTPEAEAAAKAAGVNAPAPAKQINSPEIPEGSFTKPAQAPEVAEKPKKDETLPKEASDGGHQVDGGVGVGRGQAGAPGRGKAPAAAPAPRGGEAGALPARGAEAGRPNRKGPDGAGDAPVAGPGDGGGPDVRPDAGGTGKPAPGVEAVPADQVGSHDQAGAVEQPEAPRNVRNHRIASQQDINPFDLSSEAQSRKAAKANIEALKLLKALEADKRKATPDEQKILARYVGWGATTLSKMVDWGRGNRALEVTRLKESLEALKAAKGNNAEYPKEVIDQVRDVLGWAAANRMGYSYGRPLVQDLLTQANDLLTGANTPYGAPTIDPAWMKDYFPAYRELADILSPEEMKAAWNSTLNAHYTSVPVVKAMWEMAKRLGFKGGNALEPSAGIGNFLGLMPEDLLPGTHLQAVELDAMTGAFLKQLYPDAKVHVKGFQDAKIANNSQDLVITNVPFGDLPISDKAHPDWGSPSIHNYFYLKGMEKLRPGGIMVAITSHFTLDSQGAAHRKAMAAMGDLVAAIRMPRTAFKANAGTEVVTDILILRKKAGDGFRGEPFQAAIPTLVGQNRAGEDVTVPVNEYFLKHPEMVLGEFGVGSMRGNEELTVNPKGDLAQELEQATGRLPQGVASSFVVQGHNENEVHADDEDPQAEGHLFVKDGQPMVIEDGKPALHPWVAEAVQKWTDKPERARERAKVVSDYVGLRDAALSQVAKMMSEAATEEELAQGREALVKAYDAFTLRGPKKALVPINDPSNARVFGDESSWARVCALENMRQNDDGSWTYTKADIFSKRTIEPFKEPSKAESVPDALEISMNMRGGLDLEYMGRLLGKDLEALKAELASGGNAFDNPETGIWEPAYLYLGGEVRSKLKAAEAAAKENEAFTRHVEALKAVQPEWAQLGRISAHPGATWLPKQSVVGLMAQATGLRIDGLRRDPVSGRWALDDAYVAKAAAWSDLGVPDEIRPWKFAEAVLLNKPLAVTWKDEDGRTHVDPVRTQQAQEAKSKAMERWQEAFYKIADEERTTIEEAFNYEVNNSVPTKFPEPAEDRFPGMVSEWNGRPLKLEKYQKIGVSRSLKNSTLLGHAVGSGKTITLIATSMEMRRLGFAKKPMISVLNSTVKQFVNAAYQLYPNAKILAPGKNERSAKDRAKLYARIATGDWDMVIIPQSFYEMIPVSAERVRAWRDDQLAEITAAIDEAKRDKDKFRVKDLERLRDSIYDQGDKMLAATDDPEGEGEEGQKKGRKGGRTSKEGAKKAAKATERMDDLSSRVREDRFATFEDLGIDALLVDEAHGFKNGFFMTSLGNVKGLNASSASKRAVGMLLKARSIQERTAGKNIVMATGTPITNTMSEAWVMMNYVRPDLLEEGGVGKFDQFISTYGEISSDTEYSAAGKFEAVERLREFVNLNQLGRLWNQAVHVVPQKEILREKLPDLAGGGPRIIMVKPTAAQEEESAWWRGLMDAWKGWDREKKQKVPVGLLYSQISRFLSLDMRTIKRGLSTDEAGGKIPAMVKEAMKIYQESAKDRGAQAIFCDVKNAWKAEGDVWGELGRTGGEPGFNAFKEVKFQLVKAGVPEHEIIIVDDIPDKDEARAEAFDKVNSGEVRFIIGSTQRLGTGVNIQKRLIAMHNLDIPGRPCDNEQRKGRGERAGNLFKEVNWIYYGVEKTLDALMSQRNLNKSKFIQQIMEGEFLGDKAEDIGTEATFSWAEIRGALSGDPRVMKYGELQAEIQKLESSRAAWELGRGDARVKLAQAKRGMDQWKKEADALEGFAEKVPAIQKELEKQAEGLRKAKDDDPMEAWMEGIERKAQKKDMNAYLGNTSQEFRTPLTGGLVLVRKASVGWDLSQPDPITSRTITVLLEGTGLPEAITPRSGTSSPKLAFAMEAMGRALEKVGEHAEVRRKWISDSQETIPVLEAKQGPFPQEEGLQAKRKESRDLEAAINADAEAEKVARAEKAAKERAEADTGGPEELHGFTNPLAAILGPIFGTRQRPDSVSIPSAFEEVERRWREAKKGAEASPMFTKAIDSLRRAKAAFTQHFDHINPNESPLMAQVTDTLRQYEAGPAFAKAVAHDMVYEVTKGLGPKRIDLFTRVLVLRDIIRNVDHGVDAGNEELPFGYRNVEEARLDLDRYERVMQAPENEPIREALRKRNEHAKAIVETLVNHGILDPDTLHDVGAYYHRQVMTYLNSSREPGGAGSDVRMKRKGFQIARQGGAHDFNAAYEQAEAEWVADAMGLIVKKETLDRLESIADIAPRLKGQADQMNRDAFAEKNPTLSAKELDDMKDRDIAKALGEDAVDWRSLAPEGYTIWQPSKGNHFYPALTLSERLLDQFLEGEAELSKEDFKTVLAMGSKRKQWVIPANLAQQLDHMVKADASAFGHAWVGLQSTWKQWQLISPFRILRYSLNNMMGDLDVATAYNPRIIKEEFGRAAADLWNYQIKHKASPALVAEIQEAIRAGVVESGITIAEIPDIDKAGAFRLLTSDRPNGNLVQKVWGGMKTFATWRENILRLAAYRWFKKELPKGRALYGASNRAQVDAITDPKAKAAKLARELIGDYGNVSTAGQYIRTHMIPFYSWMEVNAPRYVRMFKNISHEGEPGGGGRSRSSAIGRAVVGKALTLPVKASAWALKAAALFALMYLWNTLVFPKEYEELKRQKAIKNGLILGRRADGSIRYIRADLAITDALEWFSLGDAPTKAKELKDGKTSLKDIAADAAKGPAEKIIKGWEPFFKTIFELVMGRSVSYPSVWREGASLKPGGMAIRDKVGYVLKNVTPLDRLYNKITHKPQRQTDAGNAAVDALLAYSVDPGEASYYLSRDIANDWMKKNLKREEFTGTAAMTEKGNALYYFKRATQWGDRENAAYWLGQFYDLGGRPKDIQGSIKRGHPLGSIPPARRGQFMSSLNEADRQVVADATSWYQRLNPEARSIMAGPLKSTGTEGSGK